MDEERDMPSELGWKVYYEEGEEWRFKPPLKMPARVKKGLEKVKKQMSKIGEGNEREDEIAGLEEEKKMILAEWERERRIKWGLEKKPEKVRVTETEEVGVVYATPKRKASRTARKKTNPSDEEDSDDEMAEWTPSKSKAVRKMTPRRRKAAIELSQTVEVAKTKGDINAVVIEDTKDLMINGLKRRRSRKL